MQNKTYVLQYYTMFMFFAVCSFLWLVCVLCRVLLSPYFYTFHIAPVLSDSALVANNSSVRCGFHGTL